MNGGDAMKCECGLQFDLSPRGILKYEDHLPCPAQPAPKPAEKIEIS